MIHNNVHNMIIVYAFLAYNNNKHHNIDKKQPLLLRIPKFINKEFMVILNKL